MMANQQKSGEWFDSVESSSNGTAVEMSGRVSNISCLSHEELTPETPRSKLRSCDTEFVKLAKTGGRKDLLVPTPEGKKTSSPPKFKHKDSDWYCEDRVNNNDPPPTPKSRVKESDTEFVKTAKEGGHKDLLAIKEHVPTDEAVKYSKKGGDWYTHDAINGVDGPPATPRSKAKASDTAFLKTAKQGGHKDLLAIKEHKATKSPKKYNKKGGDWYYQDGVDIKESLQKRDHATPASARVQRNYRRLQVRNTDTDYVKTAKKGGHSDILKTPQNNPSKTPVGYKRSDWYYLEDNTNKQHERPKTAPRRTPTMTSTVLPSDSVDSGLRPCTAYRKTDQPIWLGGSGAQFQPSPRKPIHRESGMPPYALHN